MSDVDDPGGLAGGMPDMGALLDSLQRVTDARAASYEGGAGGGAVVVRASGDLQFEAVTIERDVVDPDDVEMLQDLVLAALHDLSAAMAEAQQAALGGLGGMGGLGDMLGGGLGGELGAADPRSDLMAVYAAAVQNLIDELGRLPGIGPKSAQRIAYHLLKVSREDALRLGRAIADVKDHIGFCSRCFNIAEIDAAAPNDSLCGICDDADRDASVLCVVEEPRDIVAVEKTGEYRGRYHVLQGAISPIEGIGPDQLRVKELLERLRGEEVQEVILCTNPNIEGEATALYLGRLLKPLGLRVTRIASGLPVGGDLEYADELTLGRALEGRHDVE